MKIHAYPLLVLSTVLLVGCEWLFPSPIPPAEEQPEAVEIKEDTAEKNVDSIEQVKVDEEEEGMEEEGVQAETMEDKEGVTAEEEDQPTVVAKGEYAAYSEGVIGNGKTSVLFFHAQWCPYCRENDAVLTRLYSSGAYDVSVYKVDYDTATALKQRYGVVSQDTFVLIDGSGNIVSTKNSLTESGIVSLISS